VPSRSRTRAPLTLAAATLLAALGLSGVGQAEPAATSSTGSPAVAAEASGGAVPTEQQISKAASAVEADPNFATDRKVSTLHWRFDTDRPEHSRSRIAEWLAWLAALFGFIAQSARVLMWVAIAIAAGLIVLYILRLIRRMEGMPGRAAKFVPPSHVQELDIRPESLPPDIGSAVRAFWDRGEHRAALALLYRGLLSRLVHVYEVPIRDSSTEGDCLALAARHMDEERARYASRLVRVWQRAVYGGESVEAEVVYSLCGEFRPTLDRAPQAAPDAASGATA
jgi:Domain of unknown function (DUF4129)